MATQQINGDPVTKVSTKNNAGTVTSFGTASGTFTSTSPATEAVNAFGSTVVDGSYVDPANAAGTFAFNNSRPVAMKLTDSLATVSNDFLLSGANDMANFRCINNQLVHDADLDITDDGVRTNRQTKAIREGKFDIYTGKFESGYPVVGIDLFLGADNNSGDKAGKVSRKNPGSLTFKSTEAKPTVQNYDKKTG
ncbi:hypothetical protein EB001_18040 [bacterium]|nr:hypothetical protein [bacterium]